MGFHGSKFATVVVTANSDGDIVPFAYQATTQAMHLMRDDILRPSTIPSQVAVKQSSDECYVPDVFFTERDEYGNEVKRKASPLFPVEYLFVDLQAGGKTNDATATFSSSFPVENRREKRTLSHVNELLKNSAKNPFLEQMSDFHLLLFLALDPQCSAVQVNTPQHVYSHCISCPQTQCFICCLLLRLRL
eukprot:m.97774 g.97774  ORF g.97774 m.97774 type:complete len:190 (+) comp12503_c0_seq1:150-719(+)